MIARALCVAGAALLFGCAQQGSAVDARLHGVVYASSDPAAVAQWYSRAFRVPLMREQDGRVQLSVGGAELAFERVSPDGPGPVPGALALWRVEDLDASFARLLELGAEPVTGIAELGDSRTLVLLSDPFGHLFALIKIGPGDD